MRLASAFRAKQKSGRRPRAQQALPGCSRSGRATRSQPSRLVARANRSSPTIGGHGLSAAFACKQHFCFSGKAQKSSTPFTAASTCRSATRPRASTATPPGVAESDRALAVAPPAVPEPPAARDLLDPAGCRCPPQARARRLPAAARLPFRSCMRIASSTVAAEPSASPPRRSTSPRSATAIACASR